jgi:flagellar P-ring protein precursor FlgI
MNAECRSLNAERQRFPGSLRMAGAGGGRRGPCRAVRSPFGFPRPSRCTALLPLLALAAGAAAEVRVQDVARLQGQRTNPLTGYGLVVGLNNTGDGGKSAVTMRALMEMHRRFAQEVLHPAELKANDSVALVAVEAVIPEFGAREGQTVDVVVSAVGEAKSLRGGRLLTTPLQYALFDPARPETQRIFALAGGKVELTDPTVPTVGLIRGGAVLEADFFYNFIADDAITLVLHDTHAGYPMAHAVARAVNHEFTRIAPPGGRSAGPNPAGLPQELAVALGPKNIRVTIPSYEQARPAAFIARVLEAPIWVMPEQRAVVTISRADRQISFTQAVTVSPTTLYVAGLGSVTIGDPPRGQQSASAASPAVPGGDPNGPGPAGAVPFSELLNLLNRVNTPPEQIIKAVEHLHRSGALHAQLVYKD